MSEERQFVRCSECGMVIETTADDYAKDNHFSEHITFTDCDEEGNAI